MNTYTLDMSNLNSGSWPDKPLIRIVSGYESGVGLVASRLALRDTVGCYRLLGGGLLVPDTGDVIETWEEMTAVPASAPSSGRRPAAREDGARAPRP